MGVLKWVVCRNGCFAMSDLPKWVFLNRWSAEMGVLKWVVCRNGCFEMGELPKWVF
jgi:hypothetical protein